MSAGAYASHHQFHMSLSQNRKLLDNVFHASAVLQGFPPAWPWNGQINSSFETNWNYTPRCLNVKIQERWHPRSDCWWKNPSKKTKQKKKQTQTPISMDQYSALCKRKLGNVSSFALQGQILWNTLDSFVRHSHHLSQSCLHGNKELQLTAPCLYLWYFLCIQWHYRGWFAVCFIGISNTFVKLRIKNLIWYYYYGSSYCFMVNIKELETQTLLAGNQNTVIVSIVACQYVHSSITLPLSCGRNKRSKLKAALKIS